LGIESAGAEYGLGVIMADVDVDGDLDIYVANDTNPNRLYLNEVLPHGASTDPDGLGMRLTEAGAPSGVDDPNSGMGVAAGDLDGDGRPDLFITNLAGQGHGVYINRSTAAGASFENDSAEFGGFARGAAFTGWGVAAADLDLDTDADVIVANGAIPVTDLTLDAQPMELFANRSAEGSPGVYEEVSSLVAGTNAGLRNGRGLALADFDNDGDLDVAVSSIGGSLALLRNTGAEGHWLTVDLGTPAPGAVVTVVSGDGTAMVRTVNAGGSYLSSDDPRPSFGLGSSDHVSSIQVRWPDGALSRVSHVDADQIVRISR
jgi:hypothetical protein